MSTARNRRLTEGRRYRLMPGLLVCAALLAPLSVPFTFSGAEGAGQVARFTRVEGRVDVLRGGELPSVSVKANDPVFVKDMVRTKSRSRAEVRFFDGTVLKIAERSRVDISEYVSEGVKGRRTLNLPRGKVEAVVTPARLAKEGGAVAAENSFEIHTPNAVAGVRGTDYIVFFDKGITWVFVKEGTVDVVNPAFPDKVVTLTAGQMTMVASDQPPQVPMIPSEEQKKILEQAVYSGFGFLGAGSYLSSTLIISPFDSPTPPPPPTPPPAVEVGRTTLSGSVFAGASGQFDYISVVMNDAIFLGPSTGQAPTIWNAGNITGSYQFGPNITTGVGSIPVSDGHGIKGNFNIGQWGNNAWSGTVNGQGTLSGGSYTGPVTFQGNTSGSYTGATSGTITGTGSGTAQ